MVTVILGIVALAGAGCAAGPTVPDTVISRDAPTHPVSYVDAANPALIMALDTEAAAAGPTPALAAHESAAPAGPDLSFSPQTPAQEALSFGVSLAPKRTYGPFGGLTLTPADDEMSRPLEFSIAAPAGATGLGVDVALAHRAGADEGPGGRVESRGAEVRLGQRIRGLAPAWETPTWDKPAWYIFASSDGQALTWTPSANPADPNRALRLQDRVTVGDVQAGVSVEANGVQASLAYVQREVTTMDAIRHKETADQSFAGVTLTWRR